MSGTVPVIFSYPGFAARYPEFGISETLATTYFNEASLYLDNTGCGAVTDPSALSALLNMITAHIAALNYGVGGVGASPLVGRVSTASEGSVSVTAEMAPVKGDVQAWFMQTKYGAAFWTATAGYRRGFYVAPQQCSYGGFNAGGWGFGGPFGYGLPGITGGIGSIGGT